jgi:Fe-S-cluster-containing dehydrogenase component
MVKEYNLIVATEDCIGCNACEVACNQEHDFPAGTRCIQVSADTPREIGGKLRQTYTVIHCLQCYYPYCAYVCPVNAIIQREDGLVTVDEQVCVGCTACNYLCPLGVMQFNNEIRVAVKCDMCIDRLDKGLQPACVAACPSHCIQVLYTDRYLEYATK